MLLWNNFAENKNNLLLGNQTYDDENLLNLKNLSKIGWY